MVLGGPPMLRSVRSLAPQHGKNETAQDQYRGERSQPNDIGNQEPILSRDGIVVVAKEQELIDGGADFISGGFDQTQAQISRGKIDAVKVARRSSFRRQQHDACGVSKFSCVSVI